MRFVRRVSRIGIMLTVLAVITTGSRDSSGRQGSAAADTGSAEMVLLPAGDFMMGKDVEEGTASDCSPAHSVHVDSFYMDRYEVTNAQYREYCEQTGARLPEFWDMPEFHCGPDFPSYPMVGISWSEARDYAEWAGKRLPTEAEWEYAARGGLIGRNYAHGDTLSPADANYWIWAEMKSSGNGSMPVGSYPPNGYGLNDMSGNVGEWVADAYEEDYYRHTPASNPPGPDGGKFRVFRGGGWHSGPSCIRVYYRNALPANWRDFNIGFRYVRDVD